MNLYLTSNLNLIPSGTLVRIFGQWSDGRTLIQTREPLSVDGIEATDGMQPNGIDIGITEETPVPWVVFEPETPVETVVDKAVDTLLVAAFNETDKAREALLSKATVENIVGLVNSDGVERIKAVEP